MGLEDRDYMRERARERAKSRGGVFPERSRPRSRRSALEQWLEMPFKSQKAALVLAVCGILLISSIPASIIIYLAPAGLIDVDPSTMMTGMVNRGVASGAMMFLPIIRLLGLALMLSSGIALIKGRRRWGYSTIVKDTTVAASIGCVLIAIVGWSIVSQGFWVKQAQRAADASTRIATGTSRPDLTSSAAPSAVQTDTIRPIQTQPRTITPGLQTSGLTPDRPFPANGTFERALPLQGKVARMTMANRSQNNAIVVWVYNLNDGEGDHEALRLYLTAGQSSSVDIPAFDYRMVVYEAPTSLGLDRGFGPEAKAKDLGLVDLKTEASVLSQQPAGTYFGYGIYQFRPGVYATRR